MIKGGDVNNKVKKTKNGAQITLYLEVEAPTLFVIHVYCSPAAVEWEETNSPILIPKTVLISGL